VKGGGAVRERSAVRQVIPSAAEFPERFMVSLLRACTALAVASFAPTAAAQAAGDSTERDYARAFYASFVEAREVDARCDLLEADRRVKFAEYLEYLRQDAVRDYDAALIEEAEDVGKRYARDPAYLDCGQAAMDRVENRYERIEFLVGIDKWKREMPEGRAFAENVARIQEETDAETTAEEDMAEPEAEAATEATDGETYLAMLEFHQRIIRIETRCRFLDEAMRTRMLGVHERALRSLRSRIAAPAAIAAVESAPDAETGCGDDLGQEMRLIAENIELTESMVELLEAIDAMTAEANRREESAASADLSVPLPPPPANRPRPLNKARKQKQQDLEHYASTMRRLRIEARCRFLPEETRAQWQRSETRYAELLRLEIGDPAAVADIDAMSDADTTCGESQRAEIARAATLIDLTQDIIEVMESRRGDGSP
jgi:hypothetical protein